MAGPLPAFRESGTDCSFQAALALQAAHDAGLVHGGLMQRVSWLTSGCIEAVRVGTLLAGNLPVTGAEADMAG